MMKVGLQAHWNQEISIFLIIGMVKILKTLHAVFTV